MDVPLSLDLGRPPAPGPGRRRTGVRQVAVVTVVAAAVAAISLTAQHAATTPRRAAPSVDLETATVQQLRGMLDDGTVTSRSLTEAYIARIKALNSRGPSLNAVRALNPKALAEAAQIDRELRRGKVRGPLAGIPVLVKDNIDVEGIPTTAGSIALENSYPKDDAPLVQRLRAAGAVILGKTNLSEFANFTTAGMPSGYSSLGGQVLNPYDVSVTPSGSSSGSGAGTAAGLAAAAIGTETSGSIISPSVANSLVGVKPTVGLVSRTGVVPISATQDTAGPMTRSVWDAAAMLTALTGVDPEDPATAASGPYAGTDYTAGLSPDALAGTRIGVVANSGAEFNAALAVLKAKGATLVPVTLGTTNAPSILNYEFKRDLNAYLARLPEDAPRKTLADIVAFNTGDPRMKFGQTILQQSEAIVLDDPATKAGYEAARAQGLTESRAAIDSLLTANKLDAIVSAQATTGIGARAGYPTVVVPSGYQPANGRPTGLSFTGTAWSEARLLALAYAYEQASRLWKPPSVVNPTLFRCAGAERAASCAP